MLAGWMSLSSHTTCGALGSGAGVEHLWPSCAPKTQPYRLMGIDLQARRHTELLLPSPHHTSIWLQSILIELHRLEKEFEAREGVTRQETTALVTQVEAAHHTSQLKEAVDRQEKNVLLVRPVCFSQ
jgi:hypothetical protein